MNLAEARSESNSIGIIVTQEVVCPLHGKVGGSYLPGLGALAAGAHNRVYHPRTLRRVKGTGWFLS